MNEKYMIGLGNYAKNDDGIGLRIVEYIIDNNLDTNFEALEAGNDGMRVVTMFNENIKKMLVIDCALMEKKPGEYEIFTPDDVSTKKVTGNVSTHEGDILKLIALGEQLNYHIPEITILAIEPDSLDMDMTLSKTLESNFQEYVKIAIKEIEKNN